MFCQIEFRLPGILLRDVYSGKDELLKRENYNNKAIQGLEVIHRGLVDMLLDLSSILWETNWSATGIARTTK